MFDKKKFNAFETNRRRKPELLTNINTNLYSSKTIFYGKYAISI